MHFTSTASVFNSGRLAVGISNYDKKKRDENFITNGNNNGVYGLGKQQINKFFIRDIK